MRFSFTPLHPPNYPQLHGAEYIQMSGRAGRRGKDDKGVVIFMVDEKMSPAIGRNLLKGNPEQLTSAFQLTYNMVLNLLRVDGINPEFMLQRSFHQFQSYTSVPPLLQEIEECQKQFEGITISNEEEFATYHKIKKVLEDLYLERRGFLTLPKYIVPFLNAGRLVEVKQGENDFGWAMIVRFKKVESLTKTVGKKGAKEALSMDEPEYDLHVLMRRAKGKNPAQPAVPGEPVANDVVAINMVHINRISSVRMKFPDDLTLADNRSLVMKKIDDVMRRFTGNMPMIDPVNDMKITDDYFKALQKKINMFEERMRKHSLTGTPGLEAKYQQFVKKVEAREKTLTAKERLKAAQELLQMEELKKKTQVLKHLNYCSPTGVLDIKGRIACELSSADELLLTEMLFDGMFTKLTVPETMALLSCLVCDEKSKGQESKLAECLSGPLRQMQDIARRLGKTFKDYDLPVDPEEYVSQFKSHLMDVVYEWAKGSSFSKVMNMTDIFEGSIIRCMRRLEEVTRQLIQAAKGIGNKELEDKFAEGIKAIKRDIVFAASLYL